MVSLEREYLGLKSEKGMSGREHSKCKGPVAEPHGHSSCLKNREVMQLEWTSQGEGGR
jgi:hypothetical protein